MGYSTIAAIKLARTSGNFALRTTGAGVYGRGGVNATTGDKWVISSTGTGIEDFSKVILAFQPIATMNGPTAGASAHATTAKLTVTVKAATQGASLYPTLAFQGDKTMTIFGGTPTSDAGTTRSYAFLGPFESARFMSTLGGKRGLALHILAASGDAVYSMAAVALPGAYSTYG